MSPLTSVSLLVGQIPSVSDELQPWMVAAVGAVLLLALVLLLVAFAKSRGRKGEDIRDNMMAAKEEAASAQGEAPAVGAAPKKSSGGGAHARK